VRKSDTEIIENLLGFIDTKQGLGGEEEGLFQVKAPSSSLSLSLPPPHCVTRETKSNPQGEPVGPHPAN
jgi:hypothetical protein